jgi:hypothetical protein
MDAVIDECFNEATNVYSVAAVLVPPPKRVAVESSIALNPNFKWRQARTGGRLAFVKATLVAHQLVCLLANGPIGQASEQEACRRRCMHRLFPALARRGATMVTLDWRPGDLNRIDEKNIQWMINRGWIPAPPALHHRFRNPNEVTLLRLADALAGASSVHSAGDSQFTDLVTNQMTFWKV